MRGGGRLARLRATSVGTSLASFSGYAHCHSSSSTYQFRSGNYDFFPFSFRVFKNQKLVYLLNHLNADVIFSLLIPDFLKKLLWYGRHHSSSFSNSTTSTPLKRRMVKKDIRRAKVEAFVEK